MSVQFPYFREYPVKPPRPIDDKRPKCHRCTGDGWEQGPPEHYADVEYSTVVFCRACGGQGRLSQQWAGRDWDK